MQRHTFAHLYSVGFSKANFRNFSMLSGDSTKEQYEGKNYKSKSDEYSIVSILLLYISKMSEYAMHKKIGSLLTEFKTLIFLWT